MDTVNRVFQTGGSYLITLVFALIVSSRMGVVNGVVRPTFNLIALDHTEGNLIYLDKEQSLTRDMEVSLESFGSGFLIEEKTKTELNRLLSDSRAVGLNLRVLSTYRSFGQQESLFNSYSRSFGEAHANTFSARPEHSEHHLGTTVDFGTGRATDLSSQFAYEPEGVWLLQNAHEYGFVLSYPEDKEKITGYIYEPWHLRYIGVGNARLVKESGLTLNEYSRRTGNQFLRMVNWLRWGLGWDESRE